MVLQLDGPVEEEQKADFEPVSVLGQAEEVGEVAPPVSKFDVGHCLIVVVVHGFEYLEVMVVVASLSGGFCCCCWKIAQELDPGVAS